MFFERPETGSRALLVNVDPADDSAAELYELASSAGLQPVGCITARRKFPDPRTYIGSGKLQEVMAEAEATEAALVLFDHDLTPSQERNLETSLKRRVLGRTGLILDIFATRARTHEGQLQVELAQLQHVYSRLVRGWTHLDRQRGGSGRQSGAAMGVSGAGETQLEADQRLLKARIKKISSRLGRVRSQRKQSRRSRHRADVKTISLVGYTNAGKSTLFNRLCEADVHAADQLFATLDPTFRQLELPVIGNAILADTVGFIRQLPHDLIDAFRATLEEVSQADLLLHVVDVSYTDHLQRMDEVQDVLDSIGAGAVPQLVVYNKIDASGECSRIDINAEGSPERVWVSAADGSGIDLLLHALTARLAEGVVETTIRVAPDEGRIRAALFSEGCVLDETAQTDGSIDMLVRIEQYRLERIGVSYTPGNFSK